MSGESVLFIIETFWNRQPREFRTFCLNSISIYFTAMMDGNSRVSHSKTVLNCIENLV